MGRWRAAAIALAVGGVILAAGYAVPRIGRPGGAPEPTVAGPAGSLACPTALTAACRAVGDTLGVPVTVWTEGDPLPPGSAVLAAAADLPADAPRGRVVASSPLVLGVWSERAGVLATRCGAVDLACLGGVLGARWVDVGGPDEWGTVTVGIPDPARTGTGLAAWALLAGEATDPALDAGLRLVSETDGRLAADLVLFGPSRADAVVASEVSLAAQLANAIGRGGRIEIVYPPASPWIDYVAVASDGGAAGLVSRLDGPEAAAAMAGAGLRPAAGGTAGLPAELGEPGERLPLPDEAERATLMSRWENR